MSIIPVTYDNSNSNNMAPRTSSTNTVVANNFNNSTQFAQLFNSMVNTVNNNIPPANNTGNAGGAQSGSGLGFGNNLTSGSPELDAMFVAAGLQYNINPNLLKAVAQVESNFRTDAASGAGAMGIMQIMPATARHLGITDPFDPLQSIMGGARYLREQLDRFNGDLSLALAAYNAGWPAVQRHGGIPPFPETQAYVPRVLDLFGNGNVTAGVPSQGGTGVPGMNNHNCPNCNPQSFPHSSQQHHQQPPPQNNSLNNTQMNEMISQMAMMMMMQMQMGSGGRNGFF